MFCYTWNSMKDSGMIVTSLRISVIVNNSMTSFWKATLLYRVEKFETIVDYITLLVCNEKRILAHLGRSFTKHVTIWTTFCKRILNLTFLSWEKNCHVWWTFKCWCKTFFKTPCCLLKKNTLLHISGAEVTVSHIFNT